VRHAGKGADAVTDSAPRRKVGIGEVSQSPVPGPPDLDVGGRCDHGPPLTEDCSSPPRANSPIRGRNQMDARPQIRARRTYTTPPFTWS